MNKRVFITIMIVITFCILVLGGIVCYQKFFKTSNQTSKASAQPQNIEKNSFNSKIIKSVNDIEDNNYLISPYSMEIALNMLREGANGDTKTQIDNLIGTRTINNIKIKDRINVANAVFIKNKYKSNVQKDYYQKLKTKYNAEILYDEFNTPKVLNDWTNKETNGMIPALLKDIPERFVMGIANALAIDVDWSVKFDCQSTARANFTKIDNEVLEVSMMSNTYKGEAKYFETEDAKGVILPYKSYTDNGEETYEDANNLEFIGILPNGNIKEYVNNITSQTINNIDNKAKETSNSYRLVLNLPMFSYDYDFTKFKESLIDLGVEDAFNEEHADLSNMIQIKDTNVFISDAIHKTHIDLNEKGTKAAAVTAVIVTDATAVQDKKPTIINLKFNKPFAYIIRDKKTKEMLFFGVVYEPSKWNGSTCSNE